jgi:hypothetical protein
MHLSHSLNHGHLLCADGSNTRLCSFGGFIVHQPQTIAQSHLIVAHTFYFFSQLAHHKLNLGIVWGSNWGEPAHIFLLYFVEHNIFNASVVSGVLVLKAIYIVEVVPEEMLVCMLGERLPLFLYLNYRRLTSDFSLLQM